MNARRRQCRSGQLRRQSGRGSRPLKSMCAPSPRYRSSGLPGLRTSGAKPPGAHQPRQPLAAMAEASSRRFSGVGTREAGPRHSPTHAHSGRSVAPLNQRAGSTSGSLFQERTVRPCCSRASRTIWSAKTWSYQRVARRGSAKARFSGRTSARPRRRPPGPSPDAPAPRTPCEAEQPGRPAQGIQQAKPSCAFAMRSRPSFVLPGKTMLP